MITSPRPPGTADPLARRRITPPWASLSWSGANTVIWPGIAKPTPRIAHRSHTASPTTRSAATAEPPERELGRFPSGAGREIRELTAEHVQHPDLPIAGGGLGRFDRWDQDHLVILHGDPHVPDLDDDDDEAAPTTVAGRPAMRVSPTTSSLPGCQSDRRPLDGSRRQAHSITQNG